MTDDDTILTDCKDICNELNKFFVNVGPNLVSKISNSGTFSTKDILNCISLKPNSFFFFFCEPCTEYEVFQNLNSLNNKKAVGVENIPIEFLKMSAEYISSLLSKLFNECILKGIFTSRLKIAKVTPLFKNGCANNATNYRSISILSPISKIFEKIIYNRLYNYFTTHNIIAKAQIGFRSKHSLNHVISDVIVKLQNLHDNKYSILPVHV